MKLKRVCWDMLDIGRLRNELLKITAGSKETSYGDNALEFYEGLFI